MPPWSQMTPQQQQMLLQMLMQRGGTQLPGTPGQAPGGLNPTTAQLNNQLANPQMGMNPMVLQYLMGMRNANPQMGQMGQTGMNPNLAQFLSGQQQPTPAYTQYPGF